MAKGRSGVTHKAAGTALDRALGSLYTRRSDARQAASRREVADGFKRLQLDGSERWRFTVTTEGRLR